MFKKLSSLVKSSGAKVSSLAKKHASAAVSQAKEKATAAVKDAVEKGKQDLNDKIKQAVSPGAATTPGPAATNSTPPAATDSNSTLPAATDSNSTLPAATDSTPRAAEGDGSNGAASPADMLSGLTANGGAEKWLKNLTGNHDGGSQMAFAMSKGKRLGDLASSLSGAAMSGAKALVGGLMNDLLHGNNPVENGIGISLLGTMYLYGWIRGLTASSGYCDDATTCGPVSILTTMAWSMTEVWMIVCAGVLVLLMVDKLIIATLFKSNNPERLSFPDMSVSIGIRIAFSWLFNMKLLLALVLSLGITFAFAAAYLTWIELRGSKVDDRRLAVRNVYVFNLAIIVMMVVAQMWLDWWWKQP